MGQECCLHTSAPEMDVHNPIIGTVHTRLDTACARETEKRAVRAERASAGLAWVCPRLPMEIRENETCRWRRPFDWLGWWQPTRPLGREFEKCWTWTIVMPQLSGKPHFRFIILAMIRYGFEESMWVIRLRYHECRVLYVRNDTLTCKVICTS